MSSTNTTKSIGALFLGAILAYGIGSSLTAPLLSSPDYLAAVSANTLQFTIGAILMLINSAIVVTIGVLLMPILRAHNKNIALGYVSARIIEAVLLVVGVISLLSLIVIGREYVAAGMPDASYFQTLGLLATNGNMLAYQVAMAALGLGSVLFCGLLYHARLVPRFVAAWGVVGYAVFLLGAVLELFGFGVGVILSIPGGLFELFLGIWLITKGVGATTNTQTS